MAPEPAEQIAALRAELAEAEGIDERRELLHVAALIEWLDRGDGEPGGRAVALWEDAFEYGLAPYLYENFYFRYDGEPFWRQVMELAESHSAMPTLKAQIAMFCVRDHDYASELAAEHGLEEYTQLLGDMEAAQDNWRKYQRSVEQRYPDLERDERNEIVYAQMAQMAEALDDDERLFDVLRRLDRVSSVPSIKGRLQLIYRDSEKWPAYVDLIKQEADALPEEMPRAKIALWREAIEVYSARMNNDMQAINLYKQILELDPDNKAALEDLIALYEQNNRTSDQIQLLERKAELAQSKRRTVEILAGIGQLYLDKFRNQAEAIKAYEAVLEIAPHYGEALEFLKEAYAKRREFDKLIDVHIREIETLEGRQARLEAYKEVAQLASDKIRDPGSGHRAVARGAAPRPARPGDPRAARVAARKNSATTPPWPTSSSSGSRSPRTPTSA